MTNAQPPRRSGSAHEEVPVGAVVTRVRTPPGSGRLAAALWLAAAFVVVAALKPWGGGGPIAATLRPDVDVRIEATPVPTEDRTATGLAAAACLGTGGWRVASLETWRNRDVRVWRAIEPVHAATGPSDPAVPAVPVVTDVLSGLGWCAPAYGDGQPVGPARVHAWQVVDGTARTVTLRQVLPEDGVTPIAALYLPASGPWLTGLVVFRYTDVGSGWSAWFAADLRIGSPTMMPSATPP